jgi:hypothetical protein
MGRPKTDVLPKDFIFQPEKVLVDNIGNIYALAYGQTAGAITYDNRGEFLDFYGSNSVEVTAEMFIDRLWRVFMNAAQIRQTTRAVPIEFSNFDIDKDGFIYPLFPRAANPDLKSCSAALIS